MADLKGKVAVITGAASGIGLAGVEVFVAAGAKVIAGDIQDEKGRALEGLIAIQLHAGNPHKTYVKQVLLKVLEDGAVLPFDQATLPSGSKKIDKPKVVSAQGKNPPKKKTPAKK